MKSLQGVRPLRFYHAIAAGCIAGAIWACADAVGPPASAVRFTPPARYHGWWSLVEACSGHTGNFDAVRWYVLPNRGSFPLEGQSVAGAFYPSGNQIVVVDSQQEYGPLVRHEMLHALMPTTSGHPRDEFLNRCGDIVVCEDRCVRDAGGPPDTSADAMLVAPNALTISVLAPDTESVGTDSGWLPVTVNVTNGASEAVRVQIPLPAAPAFPPSAFSYRVTPVAAGRGDSAGYAGLDGTFLTLAPAGMAGATRRFVFDARPTVPDATPGDYNVTGIFLGTTSPRLALRIQR